MICCGFVYFEDGALPFMDLDGVLRFFLAADILEIEGERRGERGEGQVSTRMLAQKCPPKRREACAVEAYIDAPFFAVRV